LQKADLQILSRFSISNAESGINKSILYWLVNDNYQAELFYFFGARQKIFIKPLPAVCRARRLPPSGLVFRVYLIIRRINTNANVQITIEIPVYYFIHFDDLDFLK